MFGGIAMILGLDTFDSEAILTPISRDHPSGTDLRTDYAPTFIYCRLRDARAEAREAERRAETESGDAALPALWRTVATLAIAALKEMSKDLEVAAWLTEALVRTKGLDGLSAGASAVAGLVRRS